MATTTGLTAELRRACMRCGGLPSAVSGHGKKQRGAGETVELWRWCWSGQARAGISNGDGGGGEELAAALAVKKEARSEMGALGGSGR